MRTVILAAALLAAAPAHAQTADTQNNYQPVKRDTLNGRPFKLAASAGTAAASCATSTAS